MSGDYDYGYTRCVATEECRRAVEDVLWRVEVERSGRTA